MDLLAHSYLLTGQALKALPLYEEYLARQRARLGAGTPAVAGLLAQVSTYLLGAGQHAAAEPYLRESLAIRETADPGGRATSQTQSMLGAALLGQRKYAEAEPLLVAGYAGLVADRANIPPAGAGNLPDAADRLVDLYAALGQPDEAKRWRAERAKYPFVAPHPRPSVRP